MPRALSGLHSYVIVVVAHVPGVCLSVCSGDQLIGKREPSPSHFFCFVLKCTKMKITNVFIKTKTT